MTFAEAMNAVRAGKKMRREAWAEGSYIFLKPGDPAAEKIEDKPRIDLMKGGELVKDWMYREEDMANPDPGEALDDVDDWVEAV